MTNKEKYRRFCEKAYVPIFSQPWWMDAVCEPQNWDVWLHEPNENQVLAAMPYYMEMRGKYKYITKAPLTQNNGIIINYPLNQKQCKKLDFEEKVINSATGFIESLGLDVYEQQYHHSFDNWAPFFWNHYTAQVKYTFILERTNDMDKVFFEFTPELRNDIKKARGLVDVFYDDISPGIFYQEHEKVFFKQRLKCPFSFGLWSRLHQACMDNNCGKIICAKDSDGHIHSVAFIVWDDHTMYLLLGGSIPQYSSSQSYSLVIAESIKLASQKGLCYDFEGSVIKRVNKKFREFGGEQKPYFRLRKIFNPEIVRKEAEDYITAINKEELGK